MSAQFARKVKIYNQKFLATQDWYDLDVAISTNKYLYWDIGDVKIYYYKKLPRRIIYPKDIQIVYGKGPRFARNLLQVIRESLGKTKGMPVTFFDFCRHTGLDQEVVEHFANES